MAAVANTKGTAVVIRPSSQQQQQQQQQHPSCSSSTVEGGSSASAAAVIAAAPTAPQGMKVATRAHTPRSQLLATATAAAAASSIAPPPPPRLLHHPLSADKEQGGTDEQGLLRIDEQQWSSLMADLARHATLHTPKAGAASGVMAHCSAPAPPCHLYGLRRSHTVDAVVPSSPACMQPSGTFDVQAMQRAASQQHLQFAPLPPLFDAPTSSSAAAAAAAVHMMSASLPDVWRYGSQASGPLPTTAHHHTDMYRQTSMPVTMMAGSEGGRQLARWLVSDHVLSTS